MYGILQLLRGSHMYNFSLKTLKLGWVAFHSVTFQLKCLDFQSNQYKKLVPVLSRFCNWLCAKLFTHSIEFPRVQKHPHSIRTYSLWERDIFPFDRFTGYRKSNQNQLGRVLPFAFALTCYKIYVNMHHSNVLWWVHVMVC